MKKIQDKLTIYYIPEMINALNAAAGSGPGKLGAMFGTTATKKLISLTNKPLMEKIKFFRATMRDYIIKRIK